jgi:phosphoribosylamine--glycine ligase
MNILFVSRDLSGADLCYRLKKEGHAVKLFIENDDQRLHFEGMIEKISDWKKNLRWVGSDGLIIFDDTGHGKIQDKLRQDGYSVVGGSYEGDKLEDVRHHGQKIFSLCGINTVPFAYFTNAKDAIKFVKENKGQWVIKQNGHAAKSFNYVGQLEDGRDVIEVLKNYEHFNKKDCRSIELQKRIFGIEIGVGRYFNGEDWVGPIEINIEHKNLCNGALGPKTYEMGTLIWYEKNEKNKLFQKTLAKLKPYLKKINYHGDIDINCIVNGKEIYPLEITARFGWPATHAHEEIHISPWGEFLKAVADGKKYNLKYKKGYGMVILIATPPFPYASGSKKNCPQGLEIIFKKEMIEKDMEHIHFEEVYCKKKNGAEKFFISSKTGFVLHITAIAETVEEVRNKIYGLADKIVIPKMFYRTDIGLKFMNEDQKLLKEWGWI